MAALSCGFVLAGFHPTSLQQKSCFLFIPKSPPSKSTHDLIIEKCPEFGLSFRQAGLTGPPPSPIN
jgi:hypothetical protein